jgi:hypothetical protein
VLGIQKGQAEAAKNILNLGYQKKILSALFHNGWVMIEAIAKKAYVFFYKTN